MGKQDPQGLAVCLPFPIEAAASPQLLMLRAATAAPFVVMSMFQALRKSAWDITSFKGAALIPLLKCRH